MPWRLSQQPTPHLTSKPYHGDDHEYLGARRAIQATYGDLDALVAPGQHSECLVPAVTLELHGNLTCLTTCSCSRPAFSPPQIPPNLEARSPFLHR